jgi:hypothetical protein
MKSWEQIWAENAKMIEQQDQQASGGGGGGGDVFGGGGGLPFDAGGETQTAGYKAYRAGEREDYTKMMGRATAGSPAFTAAELKRGYRRIKA